MYGLEALADIGELLASELVTNAVRHTRGPSALRLRADGERVRIGVSDSDPSIPAPFNKPSRACGSAAAEASAVVGPPDTSDGGRGLALVRLCAHDWGGFPLGDAALGTWGKFLWCELTVTREDFRIAA